MQHGFDNSPGPAPLRPEEKATRRVENPDLGRLVVRSVQIVGGSSPSRRTRHLQGSTSMRAKWAGCPASRGSPRRGAYHRSPGPSARRSASIISAMEYACLGGALEAAVLERCCNASLSTPDRSLSASWRSSRRATSISTFRGDPVEPGGEAGYRLPILGRAVGHSGSARAGSRHGGFEVSASWPRRPSAQPDASAGRHQSAR